MYLSLTNEQKVLIDEIAALSGIQKNVIREVWEFTLLRWAEAIGAAPEDSRVQLEVPFLGKISLKYESDSIEESGAVTKEVSAFVSINPMLKKLVGDIRDEGSNLVTNLLEKKIENAAITTTASNH